MGARSWWCPLADLNRDADQLGSGPERTEPHGGAWRPVAE